MLWSLCHPLQTSFAHPPSSNVGTTAAFLPTGCVTALTTVVMVLMKTRNAVSDSNSPVVTVRSPIASWAFWVKVNFPIMLLKNPRPAVLRLSSVPVRTCVCRNAGSATETRTVPMAPMRALKLAAVSNWDSYLQKNVMENLCLTCH